METDTKSVENAVWEIDHWWSERPSRHLMVALSDDGYKVLRADDLEGPPLGVFRTQEQANAFARAQDDIFRLLHIVKSLTTDRDAARGVIADIADRVTPATRASN